DSKATTNLGAIHRKGDYVSDCSVSATSLKGSDVGNREGYLTIRRSIRIDYGSLSVEGGLNVDTVRVGRNVKARGVDVGGSFDVYGSIDAGTIDIDGRFHGIGIVRDVRICVDGSIRSESEVFSKGLDVDGIG
ncbi:MAG: hypothetical protein N3E44_02705, partial [Candidatus Bathyarchaeota archaeon]|nr:hypothetical protein [Candidatus Bathyarchaeota archaeon]